MRTGVLDGALDACVENESPSTLDAVVKNILKKVPRSLAWGIGIQLLENIRQDSETAEMAVEDATTEAEAVATANAFKRIAAVVLAASPAN